MSVYKVSVLRLIFVVMLAVLASGCSSTEIELSVASQPNVNPDHTGRPSPVILRIYELKSDLNFQQADFYSLFNFDKNKHVLSADLLAVKELTCIPENPYTIEHEPLPETRYLGVIAGFRQLERAQWRAIVPIEPKKTNRVFIELNDTTLFLVPEEQRKDWTPEKAIESFHQQLEHKSIK